jgi:hypothetical protein
MKISVLFFLLLIVNALGAQEAAFKDVKGKVEFQLPGKDWVAAKVGDTVPAGTLISTGFKATASLSVLGSVISLKPLTRLSLEELVNSGSGSKTTLKLLSGKVKAEVRPQSEENSQQFEVKGPNATASVRGTGLDTDGESIFVSHGSVEFVNAFGISRSVQGGEFTKTSSGASVAAPIAVKPPSAPVLNQDGTVNEEKVVEQEKQEFAASGGGGGGGGVLDQLGEQFSAQVDTRSDKVEVSVSDIVQKVVSDILVEQAAALSANLTIKIN